MTGYKYGAGVEWEDRIGSWLECQNPWCKEWEIQYPGKERGKGSCRS